MPSAVLKSRGIVGVAGPEARSFLQGLVTNDVGRAVEGACVYAWLLTPQGKFLFDFFVFKDGERYLLDCDGDRAHDLLKRLHIYKLRAKIELTNQTHALGVGAAWDEQPPPLPGAIVALDPRLPELGLRLLAPRDMIRTLGADEGAYEAHRLALGVPDHKDFEIEGTFLLDGDGEELNAVDFRKGCYVGQELTARMKHRGTARKRMVPVEVDGALPAPGTPILNQDGLAVGEIRSGLGARAIAALRLDRAAEAQTLTASGVRLSVRRPAFGLTAPQTTA